MPLGVLPQTIMPKNITEFTTEKRRILKAFIDNIPFTAVIA